MITIPMHAARVTHSDVSTPVASRWRSPTRCHPVRQRGDHPAVAATTPGYGYRSCSCVAAPHPTAPTSSSAVPVSAARSPASALARAVAGPHTPALYRHGPGEPGQAARPERASTRASGAPEAVERARRDFGEHDEVPPDLDTLADVAEGTYVRGMADTDDTSRMTDEQIEQLRRSAAMLPLSRDACLELIEELLRKRARTA